MQDKLPVPRSETAGNLTVTAAANNDGVVMIGVAPIGLVLFPSEAAKLAVKLLHVAGDALSGESIAAVADESGVDVRPLFLALRSERDT